ncbi:MAG: sigma 54-interacting transcriptional regulator [Coriobacteriaceae bacterium]|jgi:transcriptional regulator of acetoin/glycerol metabolism|nr:sigma 54-interacting transcriptional regulator [Coriobacteriaceae bacterium]
MIGRIAPGFAELEQTLLKNQPPAARKAWDALAEAKRGFLESAADPRPSGAVRTEIAESWLRSREAGLDPHAARVCAPLDEQAFEGLCARHRQLIEAAEPVLNAINGLDLANDYVFEITDPSGVSLLQTGNFGLHEFTGPRSVFNEATMGTCAHSLCVRYKTSFQVVGPEHYSTVLQNLNAIAAPIFDERDEVAATLLLTQPLVGDPWLPESLRLQSHTLGLVLSLTSAIGYKLQLRRSQAQLRRMQRGGAGTAGAADAGRGRGSLGPVGDDAATGFDDILGNSKGFRDTVALAKRFALTGEHIILSGESGTGKELFAQAIHNYSKAGGAFMSINCAAIPPRLIESELFGYESGSFTGAEKGGRPGKVELADGGTLFLDEIGDMALDLQATLLRVLENKRVMRVGGRSYRQIDFRVIAATNSDLGAMVESGRFRADLLFRLSVLALNLPPLRERPEDKRLFAHFFLDECRQKGIPGPGGFAPETLEAIEGYDWPGNVRQLKNAVTAAFYSAAGPTIAVGDLPASVAAGHCAGAGGDADGDGGEAGNGNGDVAGDGGLSLGLQEERLIRAALARTQGNIAQAAALLGISKATLYRKLDRYRIRPEF